MEPLSQLIAGKFDYVNPDITEKHFPVQADDERKKEYKLYHFGKSISSEDAIKEMEKDGYVPATLRDMLQWEEWNGEDWVVALGSVWRGSFGYRNVPFLYWRGCGRKLILHWFVYDWNDYYRFLAVRKLASGTLTSEPLDLDGKVIEFEGVKYRLTKDEA